MAVKINIQYPMAYQPPFEVIHIGDASRGGNYICLGCDEEMIPRKGQIKRRHFAHKAGLKECNPDNALHETAKAAICQRFMSAVQLGQEYLVQFPCSRCRQPIGVNVASQGAAIATETSVIQGTRSDLVITKVDGKSPRVIIEIVVHHDIEEPTGERYRDSSIPVIKVRPTWETVDRLTRQAFGEETLNVKDKTCRRCKETSHAHRQWLEGTREKLHDALRAAQGNADRPLPIRQDRYGSFLRRDTQDRVNANARRLAATGFTQQTSRPTLFRVQADGWTVYADLDSTEVMRIWEVDCATGLYAFPEDTKPPRCRQCVLDIVREILEQNGVEIRRYFVDHGAHNHWAPDAEEEA